MKYKFIGVKAVAILAVLAGAIATMQAGDPPLPEDMQQPINILVSSSDTVLNGLPSGASGIASKPFFSVEHVDGTPDRTADKVKFQLATDPLFDDIIWGSRWEKTTPVTSGERSDDVNNRRAGLDGLTTYYVRARFRNATEVGPWSIESFAFSTAAVVLPATDYLIDGQAEGATNVGLKPTFSAVYNHQDPTHAAHAMMVNIYSVSDDTQVWGSRWVDIEGVRPGTRGPDLTKRGASLSGLTEYRVRIFFRNGNDPDPIPIEDWPIPFSTEAGPIVPKTVFVDSANAQEGQNAELKPIVDATPVFSMIVDHQNSGAAITHAQIQISMSPEFDDVFWKSGWNSGWESVSAVLGSRISDIAYDGHTLLSGQQYFIRVRSKDGSGNKTNWSTVRYSFVTLSANE